MRGGWILAAAAATASTQSFDCGPNPHEIGQIVLMTTPAIYVLGVAIVTLLLHLWRAEAPVWPPRWTWLAALGALHCALAARFWPSPPTNPPPTGWRIDAGTLLIGVWLYGTSYATVMLVAMRVAIRAAPRVASLWPHVGQIVGFSLPAVLLASDQLENTWFWERRHAEHWFTTLGLTGWVSGPILVLLVAEILIRRRRRRARATQP